MCLTPYFHCVSMHLTTTNTSIRRPISPPWDVLVCDALATLSLEGPRAGLSRVVIVTVTAPPYQGRASRASCDIAGLAIIAQSVTAYFSSLILARPYTPLSWLWRASRLSSFLCILQEFLSRADQ